MRFWLSSVVLFMWSLLGWPPIFTFVPEIQNAEAAYSLAVSNVNPGWSDSTKRVVFHNGSLIFLLYSKGDGNIYYKSSADNVSWSPESTLIGSANSSFDMYLVSDTKLDLVYMGSPNTTYVRTCTISGATITCGNASAVEAIAHSALAVARSGGGDRIYVVGQFNNDFLRIYSANQTGDAQNVTSWTREVEDGSANPTAVAIVPYQAADRALVMYTRDGGGSNNDGIFSRVITHPTAGSEVEVGNFNSLPNFSSPVRVSDADFRTVVKNPAAFLEEWRWNGTSWSQLVIFNSDETDQDRPSLFYDPISGDMHVFSVDTGADDVERHYKPSGGSWQIEVVADGGEATAHSFPITQMHEPPYGSSRTVPRMLVWAYRVANGANYDLKVGTLSLASCGAVSDPAYAAANSQAGQAIVYWSSADPVLILRKATTTPPDPITDAPSNGTGYAAGNTIGASTVIYDGASSIGGVTCTGTNCTNTGLSASTTYYYKVFSRCGTSYSSPGVEVNARQEAGAYPPWSYMMANGSTMRAGIAGEGSVNSAGNFARMISLNTSNGTQAWTPAATTAAVQGWVSWLPGSAVTSGLQSLQTGTVTMPAGGAAAPQTVNVGAAQGFAGVTDLTKSVLFFSLKVSSNDAGDGMVRGQLTSATNIQFYRADDTSLSNVTIRWYVAEFVSGVSVRRGTAAATTNVTLSPPVDPAKSFALISCSAQTANTTYDTNDYFRARLIDSTTLELYHNGTPNEMDCDWQVVEYQSASVQRNTGTLASGSASTGAIAITPVDTTKSFVQVTWFTDALTTATGANFLRARLTDVAGNTASSITLDRGATGSTLNYAWEVVSFTDSTTVQSGNLAFTTAQTSLPAPISVSTTRAVAFLSGSQRGGSHGYVADDEVGPGWFTTTITNSTTLTVERQITGSVAADAAWFVIQFPQTTGPMLVAGDQSGRVYALNATSGTTLWQVGPLTGADAVQAPVAAQLRQWSDAAFQAAYTDDVLFVATRNASSTNNKVFALRASDGSIFWTFNDGVPVGDTYNVDYIVGMPWVDYERNRVYVTSRAGAAGTQASLWVINSLTGALVQSFALGHLEASPTVSYDGNTLYVGATNGDFYAYNLNTLTQKWWTALPDGVKGFVWEDWNTPGRLYLATTVGDVRCLQDNGGSVSPCTGWTVSNVAGASTPLPLTGKLYVGSSDGKVHQLRLSDGVDEKQFTVGSGAYAVGDVSTEASSEIFVPTLEGKLYKLPLPLP